MPLVKVLAKSFINNAIREEGEVFEYNGPKIEILTPVDAGDEDDQCQPECHFLKAT